MFVQLKLDSSKSGQDQSGPPPNPDQVLEDVQRTLRELQANGGAAVNAQGPPPEQPAPPTNAFRPVSDQEYDDWRRYRQLGRQPPDYLQLSAEEIQWREEQCRARLDQHIKEIHRLRIEREAAEEALATARRVADQLAERTRQSAATLSLYESLFDFALNPASTLPPIPSGLIQPSPDEEEDITDRTEERPQEPYPIDRAPQLGKPVEEPSLQYRVDEAAGYSTPPRDEQFNPQEWQEFYSPRSGRYFRRRIQPADQRPSVRQYRSTGGKRSPAKYKRKSKPNAAQRRKRRHALGIPSPTPEQKAASGPPPKKPRYDEDRPNPPPYRTSYERSQQDRSQRPRSPPHRPDLLRSPAKAKGPSTPPTLRANQSSRSDSRRQERSYGPRTPASQQSRGYQGAAAAEGQSYSSTRNKTEQQSRSSGKGKSWASRPRGETPAPAQPGVDAQASRPRGYTPAPASTGIEAYVPSRPLPEPSTSTGRASGFRIQPPVSVVKPNPAEPSTSRPTPSAHLPASYAEHRALQSRREKEEAEREKKRQEEEARLEEQRRQNVTNWHNAKAIFLLKWPHPRFTPIEQVREQWNDFRQLVRVKYPDDSAIGFELHLSQEAEWMRVPEPPIVPRRRQAYVPPEPEPPQEVPPPSPVIKLIDDDITDPTEDEKPDPSAGSGRPLSPATEEQLLYPERASQSIAGRAMAERSAFPGVHASPADPGNLPSTQSSARGGSAGRPGDSISVAPAVAECSESHARDSCSSPDSEPYDVELSPRALAVERERRRVRKREAHHRRQQSGAESADPAEGANVRQGPALVRREGSPKGDQPRSPQSPQGPILAPGEPGEAEDPRPTYKGSPSTAQPPSEGEGRGLGSRGPSPH